MLFQIIDQKQNCKNIYSNNKIISNPDYKDLTGTWSYHSSLKENNNIEYASLLTAGKSFDECCPDNLQDKWNKVKEKHFSFIRSFKEAKVQSSDHCFYDLVPESFVIEYFEIKNQITDHVLNNYNKPSNYDFLLDLSKLVTDIKNRKLSIDPDKIKDQMHQLKTRSFYNKLHNCRSHIDYNIFGSITGRLTTRKHSFPILTMDKNYRSIIEPNNDWFVELDFNAAELRCLLSLNGNTQPEEDLHKWHQKILNNLYDHESDREEIKRKIFGWLYGPVDTSLGIPEIEKYYDKRKATKKYWNGKEITNPFERKIASDEFHSLNYLIQSTTTDLFLRQAIKINKKLSGKKTCLVALIHDSILLDFSREDKGILKDLEETFSNTALGNFKASVKVGTSFGNMRKLR